MRALFLSSFATFAFLGLFTGVSLAEPGERAAAQQLCRAEIAARAGAPEEAVRLDQMRERAQRYRFDFDLWSADGRLTNVRCDVARGETPTIVALNLPESTMQAAR